MNAFRIIEEDRSPSRLSPLATTPDKQNVRFHLIFMVHSVIQIVVYIYHNDNEADFFPPDLDREDSVAALWLKGVDIGGGK